MPEANNDSFSRKIVIRRLPPTLSKEKFLDIISPVPEHDYFYYCDADQSLGPNAFCRAYIYFKNFDDIYSFRDRFDNYVFVDSKSNEYPALVEFAPFQRKLDSSNQKKDSKINTIEQDSDYIKFLENFDKQGGEQLPSCEQILEELEQKEKEKNNDSVYSAPKVMTPLLEYLKKKREEKRSNKHRDRDRDRDRDRERDREREKRRKEEEKRGNNKRKEDQYREGSSKQQQSKGGNKANKNEPTVGSIKIMTKPQSSSNPQDQESKPKSTSSNANKKEEKQTSATHKSQSSNRQDTFDNRAEKSSSHHSHQNHHKNAASSSARSGGNSSARDAKDNYNSTSTHQQQASNRDDAKTKQSASSNSSKSASASNQENKDGKNLKNKERPSMQIYNPGQRASQKNQQSSKNN